MLLDTAILQFDVTSKKSCENITAPHLVLLFKIEVQFIELFFKTYLTMYILDTAQE